MSEKLLRQILETEITFGLQELPKSAPKQPARMSAPSPVSVFSGEKASALQALHEEFRNCTHCALSATRTQVVFGAGNPESQLMFVGEAPGYDEDKQGLPFVGAAGQLLTRILEAMKLRRDDVYIANCLKCRPPENRNPLPEEIAACNPILMRQIEIIQPKIICALGKFAAQTLLQTQDPISRIRGNFYDYQGIKLIPTFHPAYLLRNPDDKKLVWADMQKIMKELSAS